MEIFTIFRIISTETQVTILQIITLVTVVRIFSETICKSGFRSFFHELIELLEKWMRKIKFCLKIMRRPVVTPPDFWIIDSIVFIMRVNGDNLVSSFGTFPMVELPFISP